MHWHELEQPQAQKLEQNHELEHPQAKELEQNLQHVSEQVMEHTLE